MDLATIQDSGNVAATELQQAHLLLKREMEIIIQEAQRMKEKLTASKHLSLALAKEYAVSQQQNQILRKYAKASDNTSVHYVKVSGRR